MGAIVAWNHPVGLITYKLAPALLAGCTVVLKPAPEAPGEAYVMGEIAEAIGLPPGVLNVLAAGRDVSELLLQRAFDLQVNFAGHNRRASRRGGSAAPCRLTRRRAEAAIALFRVMEIVAALR